MGKLNSSLAIGGAVGRIVRARALPKRYKVRKFHPCDSDCPWWCCLLLVWMCSVLLRSKADMCHGKKSRSKILKVPHQVYNSGSWVPKVPRQVGIISGSWVPKVPCQVYILGSWVSRVPRPVYPSGSKVPKVPRQVPIPTFQDPGFPRSHDKYKFQDPESSRSHNLESPKSHKYTFQDPESPRSYDE